MTHTFSSVKGSWTRRRLLKTGLLGGLVLVAMGATASLTRCNTHIAGGKHYLLITDLPMLNAIIPVILEGAVPPESMDKTIQQTLSGLDYTLSHFSPSMRREIRRLFDLLTLSLPRRLTTGIWHDWSSASTSEIQGFLQRWQQSRFGLLQSAATTLIQVIAMAWYAQPDAWEHCGYPGPPVI